MFAFASAIPISPSESNSACGHKQPHGVGRVLSNFDKSIEDETGLDHVRPFVQRLVRRAEVETGSKMRAYEEVGSAIGKSSSWVRKFVSAQGVGLNYLDFRNIARAYAAMCDRIDAAAARERRHAEYLGRICDALGEKPVGVRLRVGEPEDGRDPPLAGGASAP